MDDRKFNLLAELIAGIVAGQSLLIQTFVKEGIIKREELGLALDLVIEKFNKTKPKNAIVIPLKSMRDSINSASPYHFPDSIQDLIDDKNQD